MLMNNALNTQTTHHFILHVNLDPGFIPFPSLAPESPRIVLPLVTPTSRMARLFPCLALLLAVTSLVISAEEEKEKAKRQDDGPPPDQGGGGGGGGGEQYAAEGSYGNRKYGTVVVRSSAF